MVSPSTQVLNSKTTINCYTLATLQPTPIFKLFLVLAFSFSARGDLHRSDISKSQHTLPLLACHTDDFPTVLPPLLIGSEVCYSALRVHSSTNNSSVSHQSVILVPHSVINLTPTVSQEMALNTRYKRRSGQCCEQCRVLLCSPGELMR